MSLTFCQEDHRYVGGESLECMWRIHRASSRGSDTQEGSVRPASIQGIEASVMWYTEGKGDEDFKVHYFQRFGSAEIAQMDLSAAHLLRTELPHSPLSYEGHLLRIRWCVRLRLFLSGGDEIVAQHPFQLTAVHAHR